MTRYAEASIEQAQMTGVVWDLDKPAWTKVGGGVEILAFTWTTDDAESQYLAAQYGAGYTVPADFLQLPPYDPGEIEIRSTLDNGVVPSQDSGSYLIESASVTLQGTFDPRAPLTRIPLPVFDPATIFILVQVIVEYYAPSVAADIATNPAKVIAPRQVDPRRSPAYGAGVGSVTTGFDAASVLLASNLIVRVRFAGQDAAGGMSPVGGAVRAGVSPAGVVRGKARRVVGM